MTDTPIRQGATLRGETIERVDDEQHGPDPDGRFVAGTAEVVPLAVLDTPQGTRIKFLGAPAEDAIGMAELGGHSALNPPFTQGNQLSILELYTRLTPQDAPVPDMLLRNSARTTTEYQELRKKYSSCEYLEDPVQVPDDQLRLISTQGADTQAGPWNCSKGTEDFQAFACQGSSPANAIRWCDASRQYNLIDRSTAEKRRYSFSLTAVCGTEIGYVRHYHWRNGWRLLHDSSLAGNHWLAVRWEGIAGPAGRRSRRVRHGVLNTPAGAYFRAFTAMYNLP